MDYLKVSLDGFGMSHVVLKYKEDIKYFKKHFVERRHVKMSVEHVPYLFTR